jgi:hypothetical protein
MRYTYKKNKGFPGGRFWHRFFKAGQRSMPKFTTGFALAEIVIGSAIILTAVLAINITYTKYMEYAFANQKNVEAAYLMEEGLEVIMFFRNASWVGNIASLSTTTTYYLTFNGVVWATTTTPQYIDGQFLRSIQVFDVKRDATDDIASTGTYDPNTKKVTATVSYYQGHGTTTRSISTYISNIK